MGAVAVLIDVSCYHVAWPEDKLQRRTAFSLAKLSPPPPPSPEAFGAPRVRCSSVSPSKANLSARAETGCTTLFMDSGMAVQRKGDSCPVISHVSQLWQCTVVAGLQSCLSGDL